jgi:hypothetical protein
MLGFLLASLNADIWRNIFQVKCFGYRLVLFLIFFKLITVKSLNLNVIFLLGLICFSDLLSTSFSSLLSFYLHPSPSHCGKILVYNTKFTPLTLSSCVVHWHWHIHSVVRASCCSFLELLHLPKLSLLNLSRNPGRGLKHRPYFWFPPSRLPFRPLPTLVFTLPR